MVPPAGCFIELYNCGNVPVDLAGWRLTDGEVSLGPPTPGRINSVYSALAPPPQIRQVKDLPKSPTSGQEVIVTAKVTDPDEVALVQLEYQLVEPGRYLRLNLRRR